MKFEVETSGNTDIADITEKIESQLDIENGICNIFVPHTTAGLTINESEGNLLQDIEGFLDELVPEKDYRHDNIDENAASHRKNRLIDSSISIPVKSGNLQLGTWQSVLFIELDGPRTRTVKVKTIE